MMKLLIIINILLQFFFLSCSDSVNEDQRTGGQTSEIQSTTALPFGSPFHDQETEEYNLSTSPYFGRSILNEYDKARNDQNNSNIIYPLCITANHQFTEVQKELFRTHMDKVANNWNRNLMSSSSWKVTKITFYFASNQECYNGTDRRGLKVLKIHSDLYSSRATANIHWYIINLPWYNFTEPHYQLSLHEYGHVIGLGDNYTDWEFQDPINQPSGIMNNHYRVTDLTEDDVAGVRHIWARLNGETSSLCPEGYIPGGVKTKNNFNNQYCIKSQCQKWADDGECSANPVYMLNNCAAECENKNKTKTKTNYFQLSTEWQGDQKILSSRGGSIALSNQDVLDTARWYVKELADGYSLIKNKFYGEGSCLRTEAYVLSMQTCNEQDSKQLWKIDTVNYQDYKSIRTKYSSGSGYCVDIVNDDTDSKTKMMPCGNYTGQWWKFAPVN